MANDGADQNDAEDVGESSSGLRRSRRLISRAVLNPRPMEMPPKLRDRKNGAEKLDSRINSKKAAVKLKEAARDPSPPTPLVPPSPTPLVPTSPTPLVPPSETPKCPVRKRQNRNLVHYFEELSTGSHVPVDLKRMAYFPLTARLSQMRISNRISPVGSRLTSMMWVPLCSTRLILGSKSGSIWIWDTENEENSCYVNRPEMVGWPGPAVLAMRASVVQPHWLFVALGDGSLSRLDLRSVSRTVYEPLHIPTGWGLSQRQMCSLDVDADCKVLCYGDSQGRLSMQTVSQERFFSEKLHNGKISHVEFHPRRHTLLVTSSVDHTVKLWDMRMMTNKDILASYSHEAGVNNATFSLVDGTRMLTTDQYGQIRVYQGPGWTLTSTIRHPHRRFQHMTPIRASWHPLEDLIIIGRYPDSTFPGYFTGEERTIDFFDASTGKELFRLRDYASGIVSLNQFNTTCDTLASAMGYNALLWNEPMQEDET